MNCRKISGMLSEFLDGSLTQKDQNAVRKHLSSCRKCRENWKYLQQYQQDIASLPPTKAPDYMIDKVLDRISKEDNNSHPHMRSFPLWPKVLITAALLAGLAYILIPGQYFLPLEAETEMQITSPKKDKGSRHEKSVSGKSDFRLKMLEVLAHKHGGIIIKTEQTHPEGLLNVVILKMPARQYNAFAEEYNQIHFGGKLPVEKRFSVWPRYIIKIYLPSHAYLIEDFNDDHLDDILIYAMSGKDKDRAAIAYNQGNGKFSQPTTAEFTQKELLQYKSENLFRMDLNGDNKINFLERIHRNGDVLWQGYSDSTRNNPIVISFEDHASGYPGDYMIFTGDFNGDGYDDLLIKNGDWIREGEWYISYNTKNLSFTRGHKVWFINDSILRMPEK